MPHEKLYIDVLDDRAEQRDAFYNHLEPASLDSLQPKSKFKLSIHSLFWSWFSHIDGKYAITYNSYQDLSDNINPSKYHKDLTIYISKENK